MPGPYFFIVWGSMVRKTKGEAHVAFCPGCLRLAKFQVEIVEKASHVYFIHGEFEEVLRYSRCPVCGLPIRAADGTRFVSPEQTKTVPMQDLIAQDPLLTVGALQKIWGPLQVQTTSDGRKQHVLRSFCTIAQEEFALVEKERGPIATVFWVFLFVAGLSVAAMAGVEGHVAAQKFGFAAHHQEIGFACFILVGTLWLAFAIPFYLWRLDRRVAARLKPRLRSLFECPRFDWSELESNLESGQLKFPKVRRHLSKRLYDEFRFGNVRLNDGTVARSIELGDYMAAHPPGDSTLPYEATFTTFTE